MLHERTRDKVIGAEPTSRIWVSETHLTWSFERGTTPQEDGWCCSSWRKNYVLAHGKKWHELTAYDFLYHLKKVHVCFSVLSWGPALVKEEGQCETYYYRLLSRNESRIIIPTEVSELFEKGPNFGFNLRSIVFFKDLLDHNWDYFLYHFRWFNKTKATEDICSLKVPFGRNAVTLTPKKNFWWGNKASRF